MKVAKSSGTVLKTRHNGLTLLLPSASHGKQKKSSEVVSRSLYVQETFPGSPVTKMPELEVFSVLTMMLQ